MTELFLEKYA